MNQIKKINKNLIIKYENRQVNLQNEYKEKIDIFWKNAIIKNPNLYNGDYFMVEKVIETEECFNIVCAKSTYANHLYNETEGIYDEEYIKTAPCGIWGGILIQTKDNYFLIGETDERISIPHCLEISGGGIESKDINYAIIDIKATIRRELKEELDINLDDVVCKTNLLLYPGGDSFSYAVIIIGTIDKNKEEVEKHFTRYKEYLIEKNLELEFTKIHFLKKEKAIQELDEMTNQKRPYLRELIIKAMNL